MKVLTPDVGAVSAGFAEENGLTFLSTIPPALSPRLAELASLTEPSASIALAARPDGSVLGLLEGDEEFRHLRFAADGKVARGWGSKPFYVATVDELPPF